MFDLAIKGGWVYRNGEFVRVNVYVKDGKIAAISAEDLESVETYDASGRWVLPGFIDPHVHFKLTVADWTSVDDFYTGSISAAFGGVTTFIDFIDPVRSTSEMEKAFEERMALASVSVVDYAFHSTIASPVDRPERIAQKSKELGMASIKLFTTYSSTNRRTFDDYIDSLLALSRDMGFVVTVHAENDEIIKKYEGKKVPVKDHSRARPTVAELSEVIKLVEMSLFREGQLYIVHVSSGYTAREVYERFRDALGCCVVLESCPHYFYLDDSYLAREDGNLFVMTPPLRSRDEVETLREYFDAIQTIGTDHCSFRRTDKFKSSYTSEVPQGIGGVEFSFVLMFTLFGEEVIDKFTVNVAKAYGLYPRKGVIEVGSDADLVVFDPSVEWVIGDHHSAADYNVYEGFEVRGKVVSTLVRGEFVVKDGRLVGKKGWGEFVRREEIFW